jgi:hypothetical protein
VIIIWLLNKRKKDKMKIIKAHISKMPKTMFDPMPQITATFEDGTEKKLFSFYPDEISFGEHEFIGLTESEAIQLKFNKDKNYIQSSRIIMKSEKYVLQNESTKMYCEDYRLISPRGRIEVDYIDDPAHALLFGDLGSAIGAASEMMEENMKVQRIIYEVEDIHVPVTWLGKKYLVGNQIVKQIKHILDDTEFKMHELR